MKGGGKEYVHIPNRAGVHSGDCPGPHSPGTCQTLIKDGAELFRRFHLPFEIMTNDKYEVARSGKRSEEVGANTLNKDISIVLMPPRCEWQRVLARERAESRIGCHRTVIDSACCRDYNVAPPFPKYAAEGKSVFRRY